ncbi:MAG: hypothetical protein V9E83_09790 [Baekduia sp.]
MADAEGPTMIDADALLGTNAVEAGVGALVQRNRHHLESMEPEEQQNALGHWRELAVEVLASARSALVPEGGADDVGRAVIVFEDQSEDEVSVHVTFTPQLQELEDGAIAGTPAQITAMSLLDSMANAADEEAPE